MEIATDRLLLREFVLDDWHELFAYQNDRRYLDIIGREPQSEDSCRAMVEVFVSNATARPRRKFQLAATLATSGELIGNCGIRRNDRNDWDADIGYEFKADHWGNGYATEATSAVLAFGFQDLRLHRTSAQCNAGNTGSIRVLETIGMRVEGRVRDGDFQKGRWWDMLHWGILESEWRGSRR